MEENELLQQHETFETFLKYFVCKLLFALIHKSSRTTLYNGSAKIILLEY